MDLIAVIVFSLVSYAMASVIVEQKIFEEARSWIKSCKTGHDNYFMRKACQFVSCMFCTGFWCGVFLTLMGLNVFNTGNFDPFFGGLFGAVSAYLIYLFVSLLKVRLKNLGIDY